MKPAIRKAMLIVLPLLLVLGNLAGCGSSGGVSSRTDAGAKTVKRLVMWKFKSNKEDYILYDWLKLWNDQHPGVQVSLELIPFTDYLTNKLPTAFATNSAPDVYLISAGSFLKYAKAGCALPLDRYLSRELRADFYKPSLETVSYHGQIMGIPIEREPVALFYNQRVFHQQKLSPPRTWAELLRCARILNSGNMAGIYLPVQPSDYQNFIFYTFLMQLCDGVFTEKTHVASFQTMGIKALELWRNLAPYSYRLETAVQLAPDIYPLASGKAAMQICGYWAVRMLEKYYPQFEYGVVPVPVLPGSRVRSVYGGWFQVINPNSKFKDEAVAFSLWMWGADPARPIEWCTEASSKFPARLSVLKRAEKLFGNDKGRIFSRQILPFAVPEPRYPSEISNVVSKAIQNALFTGKPLSSIAAKADEAINHYFRSNRGDLFQP
jgi:multiple sugar transport system substrate-binding protein